MITQTKTMSMTTAQKKTWKVGKTNQRKRKKRPTVLTRALKQNVLTGALEMDMVSHKSSCVHGISEEGIVPHDSPGETAPGGGGGREGGSGEVTLPLQVAEAGIGVDDQQNIASFPPLARCMRLDMHRRLSNGSSANLLVLSESNRATRDACPPDGHIWGSCSCNR